MPALSAPSPRSPVARNPRPEGCEPTLSHSIQRLPPLGRWLYDGSVETLWERDTHTLPRYLRARRRAYRRFPQQQIAPLALEADRLPLAYDPRPLLAQAGRSSRSYRSGESFVGDVVVTLGLERHDEGKRIRHEHESIPPGSYQPP
jgi:hypothetical protein